MFGIHRGFLRLLSGQVLFIVLLAFMGLVFIYASIHSYMASPAMPYWFANHSRNQPLSPGEQLLFLMFGVLVFTFSVYGGIIDISWLRRASQLMRDTRPVPVLVTFRIEEYNLGRSSRRVNLFASLQLDREQAGSPPYAHIPVCVRAEILRSFPDAEAVVIADIPLMTGVQSSGSRYPGYQQAPGLAYLDPDPSAPVVITVNEQYWCSESRTKRPSLTLA